MSSCRFVSLDLLGPSVLLLLLLLPGLEARNYEAVTLPSEYEYDDDSNSSTIKVSFFMNTSSDYLDIFSRHFWGLEDNETGTEGPEDPEDMAVTTATTRRPTERSVVKIDNAAALPVCPEIRTLLWSLMILMILNSQQLRHTLC